MNRHQEEYFKAHGEDKSSFRQINEAMRRTKHTLITPYTRKKIKKDEAMRILGEDEYLSGIQRSAFHGTATRKVMGQPFQMVLFDSSALWK
jgi:hypothetical protein